MPEKHRFPMRKYRMTRQALQAEPMLRDLLEVRQVGLPAQSINTKTPCPSAAVVPAFCPGFRANMFARIKKDLLQSVTACIPGAPAEQGRIGQGTLHWICGALPARGTQ
jgi:hypothetical protein